MELIHYMAISQSLHRGHSPADVSLSSTILTLDVRSFMACMPNVDIQYHGISIGLVGVSNAFVHVACHFNTETSLANPYTLFTFELILLERGNAVTHLR